MGNHQSTETGAELSGHTKAVYSCCCSQDGSHILSASGDGTLKLWDLEKLKCVRDFIGHRKVAVYACALSANGKHAVSGALDGSIKVWSVQTGREMFSVAEHQNAVMQVAFHPQSLQVVSASADKTIVIWDLSFPGGGGTRMHGEKVATLTGHRSAVNAISFFTSGESLVSGSSDTTVKVWNLANMKEVRTLQGHKDAVMAVAASADGKTIVSSSQDQMVCVWLRESGKLIKTLKGHTDAVSSCAIAGDASFILSASLDRGVIAWVCNTEHGNEWERACTFRPHRRGVTSCAITPDGMVSVTGGWDNTLQLSPLDDVRLSASLATDEQGSEESPLSLQALLRDPLLTERNPHLVDVVADMANLEGAHRAKAKMGLLVYFYLRYAGALGCRRPHRNMILFGQQGTGKMHSARLLARFFVQAAGSGGGGGGGAARSSPEPNGDVTAGIGSVTASPAVSMGGGSGEVTRVASGGTDGGGSGENGGQGGGKGPGEGGVGVLRKSGSTMEVDDAELTVLKFSKLTANEPELSARKLNRFLEKHSGQVILAKEAEWLETQPVEVVQAVVGELQRHLNENPSAAPLLLAARSRENLNALLRHYVPATPAVIRAHFPFMMDFDKYTAEELRDIFTQQCHRDQLRLGNTVTAAMLTKTFVLNFSFFDGSNGAGTKHLLNIARMEQARRADRKEGVLEAGDIQAAFQRLRQDWYAAHPERTFSTLKEMSQKEMDRRRARSSLANEDEASEDAKIAVKGEGDMTAPEDGADDAGQWSFDIDELKKFHDQEMQRKDEEHKQSLQIYQDECDLFVKGRDEALRLTVDRMLQTSATVAERRFKDLHLNRAMANWQLGHAMSRRELRQEAKAESMSRLSVARNSWMRWVGLAKQRRHVRNQDKRARRLVTCSLQGLAFEVWREIVVSRKAAVRKQVDKFHKLSELMEAQTRVLEDDAVEEWWHSTMEERQSRGQQLEELKRTQEHEEAINALIKRHQSEVTEWHLSYQEKIKAQKDQRKAAETSLHPLMQWRHTSNVLAALLVLLYTAPTFPAVAPYFVATLRTFSFGHWYVGLLILASLIGASRRLFSWLHKSVLPQKVKVALHWCSGVGLDSIVVGVGIAWLCWPYICNGPGAWAGDGGEGTDGDLEGDEDDPSKMLPCMPEDAPGTEKSSAGDGPSNVAGPGCGACDRRVELLFKAVVAVAGWAVTQEAKEMLHRIWKEGVGAWLKNTAASVVPSWYYSLSDNNVAEMVDLVLSETNPPGKKTRACVLLADLASQGQEMRNVITEAGGVKALVAVLKAAPDSELFRSAALAATQLCTTERVASAVASSGGITCLVRFWDKGVSDRSVKQSLRCASALVKAGAVTELINAPKCITQLKAVITGRSPAVRHQALLLVADMAQAHQPGPAQGGLQAGQRSRADIIDEDEDFSRPPGWRELLAPVVPLLVSELQSGWWIGLYCANPECKAAAVRALGLVADGSPEDGDRMVRQGLNQALVRILKLRATALQSQDAIMTLQYNAACTVGVIARGGDLQRGRLQEAGMLNLLDVLYQRLMCEPTQGKDLALMKQHVLNALQAVKGGGHLLRTPPLSGTSTPNSSSIPSSPRSSPPRGRK